MVLQAFLEYLYQYKSLSQYSVVCFVSREYPLLFLVHVISFLQKNGSVTANIDASSGELGLLKAHVSTMSFSGKTAYWCNGMQTISAKKQQEWIDYVQIYAGPHTILFFSNDESVVQKLENKEHILVVTLPDFIASQDFSQISYLVHGVPSEQKTPFIARLTSHTPQLSLDNACLFAYYDLLLGKNSDTFFKEWITHLIEPTQSLFLLSQHFFSKKHQLFFEQWSYCSEGYLPPFWATFWADQLWRAYMYCDLMQQKKFAEAKKVQYKLPFSLINRDWSSLQLSEIARAHHYVAAIDFRLKNGGSPISLELFYSMFFDNKFRSL